MEAKRTGITIRPYGDHIRKKAAALLESLGYSMSAPDDLREGADAELVARAGRVQADLFMIPFNVQRVADGARTNGVQLVQALRAAHPKFARVPVVMPVSVFAKVAFGAAVLPERVFPLYEDAIEAPETAAALRTFLRG